MTTKTTPAPGTRTIYRWKPVPADQRNPRHEEERYRTQTIDNPSLVIKAKRDDGCGSESTLARAILKNGLTNQAGAQDPRCMSKSWYHRIPLVSRVRAFVTDGDRRIQVTDPDTAKWDARTARTWITVQIYGESDELIRTVATRMHVKSHMHRPPNGRGTSATRGQPKRLTRPMSRNVHDRSRAGSPLDQMTATARQPS